MKTQLKDKASIPLIIKELTLEEKVKLLTGSTTFRGGDNKEHGIPAPLFLDGGTGFNSSQMRLETFFVANGDYIGGYDAESITEPLEAFGISTGIASKLAKYSGNDPHMEYIMKHSQEMLNEVRPSDGKLGCYPPGMFLGATMNPEIIEQCGEALGREASACHIDVLLGSPNVNLHRDPRNGRLFEGYSEDPCVVSKLAPSFVKGVQSTGIVANVKHFAANNQETDRMGVNEIIDERALRELYLPGFKACVESGCKTVMTAYNRINGVPCAQSEWLLKKVLREEWNFKGFVMSDWGAVYDRAEAVAAGNDVTMPGPREIGSILRAVRSGELDEKEIDEACANYLNILLEMPVMKGRRYEKIDPSHSMKVAYDTACEGITLLKNQGVLPLNKKGGLSFYGKKCRKFLESGTGSAAVVTNLGTNLFDSAVSAFGEDKVYYETIKDDTQAVIVTVGSSSGEGADQRDLHMDEDDRIVLEKALSDAKVAKKPAVLILNVPGPIELMEYIDQLDAVLCVYYPGMAGGKSALDILLGDVNPSGKLPISFPKYYRDTPTYLNFPGEYQKVYYGEGIYVGYRYYDIKEIEPLYPFGHGLSYTTFELSGLEVPDAVDLEKGTVPVSLRIKNTGAYAGAEVIQVYVSDLESTLKRPKKELKNFKKVYLEPGEEKTVQLELTSDDLACYDIKMGKFVTEPGMFEIQVGTSSRLIILKKVFEAKCPNPYRISEKTEIAKFIVDGKAMEIMARHLPKLDLKVVAGVYIVFLPFMTFEEVWKRCVVSELTDISIEAQDRIYALIVKELREL